MSFSSPELDVVPGLGESIAPIWRRLGSPGATWTGKERVAMIAEARSARSGADPTGELDAVTTGAVRTVAARPAAIRREWVSDLLDDGLDHPRYVELIAVVSRAVAIDTLFEALALEVEWVPEPLGGEPSGDIDRRARLGTAWVPMVGGAGITQALSLVPAENAELERLHGPLYLTFEQMSDPAIHKGGLSRPQLEVVAARTSAHNECFYWVLAHTGMLRWSAQTTDTPVDLRAVVDSRIDPLLPAGRELVAFVDSVLAEPEPFAARAVSAELGEEALVTAASVIANFQMMNIVADATGMPVGKGSRLRNADLIEELGLARFDHVQAGM